MTEKARKVLEYAGVRPEWAQPRLIELAEEAVREWQYLPHAAAWLRSRLAA